MGWAPASYLGHDSPAVDLQHERQQVGAEALQHLQVFCNVAPPQGLIALWAPRYILRPYEHRAGLSMFMQTLMQARKATFPDCEHVLMGLPSSTCPVTPAPLDPALA